MYERVLVATDGSESAEAATDHAIAVAEAFDADLHAVAVVETRTGYDNAIVDPDTVRENLRADADAALQAVTERAEAAGMPVETARREGVPAEEIQAHAAERDVDLLLLGAVGRSGFQDLLLGSTVERVIRQSPIPVTVVGTGDREVEPARRG